MNSNNVGTVYKVFDGRNQKWKTVELEYWCPVMDAIGRWQSAIRHTHVRVCFIDCFILSIPCIVVAFYSMVAFLVVFSGVFSVHPFLDFNF